MLRNLGYLSPRTFYINVEISGRRDRYIFQENLKKEFLEFNKKVEGPIIEKNEDFWINPQILQMSRVTNKEWIKSQNSNLISTIEAIKKVNKILLHSFNYTKNVRKDHILRFKKNFFSESEYERLSSFNAFMFALDCWAGLTFDDRRYYYDPIYSTLEPIYYDGMSKILSQIGFNVKTEKYENQIGKGLGPDPLFYNDNDYDHGLYTNYVSDSAIFGSNNAINKIKNLDKKKLIFELKQNGLKNINQEKLELLISSIIERLTLIKNAKISKFSDPVEGNIFFIYKKNMKNLEKNKYLVFLNKIITNNKQSNQFEIEICDFKLKNCKILKISYREFELLLEQRKFREKYSIFLALTKNDYLEGNLDIKGSVFNNKLNLTKFDNQLQIAHSQNIKIYFKKKKRKLNIDYLNNKARVIIFDSKLNDLKIKMQNLFETSEFSYDKINGLTGCLTIIDTEISNTQIIADNFYCEDTLNFIRSKGNITNIIINNALSDGFDADFSNLEIKNISVDNTSNDCLDFSFGVYKIENSKLSNCGDKALSVGEKSKINIKMISILNSNYGIVSKDSSSVLIDNANIQNVNECFAAYNKKQEFKGGFIGINNSNCADFENEITQDEVSNVQIINRN